MLCPACRTTSTKKEREGGKCPKCGRAFRFDPPQPLSDAEMEAIVAKVSQKGRHKYTRSQLVAETERLLVRRERLSIHAQLSALTPNGPIPWLVGGGCLVFAACLISIHAEGVAEVAGFAIPFLVFAAVFLFYAARRESPEKRRAALVASRPTGDARAELIVRAYESGGAIEGILPPPRTERPALAHRRELDLESFGFDRVVVVEGRDMVDMLVANRFHFDHNAAVVSFDGYPQHVAELVRRQVENGQVHARVFLLHSATAEGTALAERWRDSGWASTATLVHVGLTSKQTARVLPVAPRSSALFPASVPAAEALILRERPVSLSALRPVQVMTLLFNAIQHVESLPITHDDVGTGVVVFGFGSPVDAPYDFG